PGAHEVIGGGLAGRVGRAWVVAGLLCEMALVSKRAENLVSRDVMEPEPALAAFAPVRQRGLEQNVSSNHIGGDELSGAIDRAIDMAFSGQMHGGIGLEACECIGNRGPVANVDATESVAAMPVNGRERGEITGIGQLVEDQDLVRCVSNEVPDGGR